MLILRNCLALTFSDQKPQFLEKQDITIEGQRILKIEPTSSEVPAHTQIIDASGMLAIPGMINTHAHVPMVLFRNAGPDCDIDSWFNQVIFPLEANLTPEDVYWGAMLGMAEMIEAGITTFADHYFQMDFVAKAVEQSGLRANLVWAVFGHEGYQKLDQTIAFVERWQGQADGRITTWLGPHSPYLCDSDFLRRCAIEAGHLGVGNHIHVSETQEQVRLSFAQHGKSPVAMLADSGLFEHPCILAHCLYPTKEDLELLAGKKVGIAQAPKTYLSLAMGLVDLKQFLERGIPVGLASDGAVSSSNLDILEQMRLTALTQKHLTQDATVMNLDSLLNLAFQGGAAVLHQPDLGNLKPGSLADVVLLRLDRASAQPNFNLAATLVYNLSATDVDTVICNGRVLYQNGQHLTLDKKRILSEVAARLPRLLRKDPSHKIAEYPSGEPS